MRALTDYPHGFRPRAFYDERTFPLPRPGPLNDAWFFSPPQFLLTLRRGAPQLGNLRVFQQKAIKDAPML